MLEASPDGGCELDSFALWGVGDSGGCGCCDLYDGCWCSDYCEADQAQATGSSKRGIKDGEVFFYRIYDC